MAVLYKSIPREKLLHVYIKGDFDLEFAKQHFLEVISLLKKHRCEKVLIDGLGIVGQPTPVERFFYGAFVAEAAGQFKGQYMPYSDLSFAYAMAEPTLDPRRLGETSARNRGMNVRAFDNLDAALDWLELTPADLLDN